MLRHAGHLGDATGVVGDRAVGVDRQRNYQRAQHAERRNGYTVHAGQHPRKCRSQGQSQGKDRWRSCNRVPGRKMMLVAVPVWQDSANFFNGLVGIRRVVLGQQAYDETGDEAGQEAQVHAKRRVGERR